MKTQYHNLAGLLSLAEENNLPLWKVAIMHESELSGKTEEEIREETDKRYKVMEHSATLALKMPQEMPGNLIKGVAETQYTYSFDRDSICGPFINRVMAYALSSSEVNASMGQICAAPTAGSCGIVPAVLYGLSEEKNIPRDKVIEGLITASAVGAVIMQNATVSGAEGGCQAECGAAAGMVAAAAVQMMGGTPRMCLDAVSITLMNVLGLVCDPVAGLVQVPCAQRNASQSVNALISADLVLGGMRSIIPADEMVESLYRVGKQLPTELRETSLGGIAITETGIKLKKEIFG